MLSLLLAACFSLPQDGMLGVGADEIVVPETPAVVREYLAQAQSKLYDPRRHGMHSLSFEAPLHVPVGPEVVEVGVVKVDWTAGEEPSIVPVPLQPLPEAVRAAVPPAQFELIQAQIGFGLAALGEQVLLIALGDVFGPLFDTHSAALGTVDGEVAITFTPAPGLEDSAGEVVWRFDEDGVPMSSSTTLEQATPMGDMTLTVTTEHTWTSGPGGKRLLDGIRTSRSVPGMSMSETLAAEHTTHGGMTLLSTLVSTQVMGPVETVKRIELRGLTVNGEAVPAQASAEAGAADGEG